MASAAASGGSSSYESGGLTKIFKKALTFGLGVAIGIMIFDPISEALFFPIWHGTAGNASAQAFMSLIHDQLGWLTDVTGLTGSGGILSMDWAQSMLAPYMAPDVTQMAGGLSLDDLGF